MIFFSKNPNLKRKIKGGGEGEWAGVSEFFY